MTCTSSYKYSTYHIILSSLPLAEGVTNTVNVCPTTSYSSHNIPLPHIPCHTHPHPYAHLFQQPELPAHVEVLGSGIAAAAHVASGGHLLLVVFAAVGREEGAGEGGKEKGLQDRAALLPLLPARETWVAGNEHLLQLICTEEEGWTEEECCHSRMVLDACLSISSPSNHLS